MKTDFDVIIVGAGLVGLTSALACAESGAKIALLDRTAIKAGTDGRASALSATSLRLFENRIIKGGALAILPLTENRSQIVWSGPTKAVMAAAALEEAEFVSLLSEKMGGYLGLMELRAPRQTYPLKLQVADSFSKGRIALVGDAAHIIHPLAGQGLNLGLRDVAALADGVKQAVETGQDIGVTGLLDYDLWRNVDTRSLGLLTHVISEVSGAKFAAIGHARRLGLVLTNRLPGLKSALEKRAAGEARALPSLMK